MSQPDLGQVWFERIDLADNARWYYLVAWRPDLYSEGTLTHMFGRRGRASRA